jgi:hydroxymethylglutaryl-CoA lyase
MSATRPRLYIQEVATRDGFQNEARFIETDDKVALIDRLSACGFAKIEVTSFTSPRAIPALRDAEAVMHRIERRAGVVYTVLVPNVRGAERALSCVDEVNLVMSVSESHNRANLRMSREESFAQLRDVIEVVSRTRVAINVSLSTAFGCPMEGDVAEDEVLSWVARFATLGVHGVTLCDTPAWRIPTRSGNWHNARAMNSPDWKPRCTFTTRGGWRSPTRWLHWTQASTASTPRWAAWAVAPMHRARRGTCAPKNSCICWN